MRLVIFIKLLGLVSWEKIVSRYSRLVYRDIVECSQAGDGPANPAARQDDEDTGVDDSCERQPVQLQMLWMP